MTPRTLIVLPFLLCFAGFASAESDLEPYGGDPEPAQLALPDLNGEVHRLGDYAGSVVLINFWASWCGPCLREMPSLQRLERKLADTPFRLLAVNVGENSAEIEPWLKELGVDFSILLDADGSATRAWRVFAFPTTFVVDRAGKVSHAKAGAVEWDSEGNVDLLRALGGQLPAR